jgi:DNA-binding transcriptional MerR regulator
MTRSARYTIVRHVEGLTGEAHRFTLETAAELTGVHRDLILEFARAELLPSVEAGGDESRLRFDEHAIYRLRQIDVLQKHHTSLRVIRDILRLLDRIEEAELEIHRLRELLR